MAHQKNMAVSALVLLAALGLAHAQYGHTFGGGYGGGYGGTTGGGYTRCFRTGGSSSSNTVEAPEDIFDLLDGLFLGFGGDSSSSSDSGQIQCIPMNTGRRSNTNVVPPHKHEPDHVHHIAPPKPAPTQAYPPPSIYRNHYAPQHGNGYGVPQHYAPQTHGYAPRPHTGYAPRPHTGYAPPPHTGYAPRPRYPAPSYHGKY